MGKIVKMSTHLANMIAAGEVVERPSSVVKELVENAIDAKSSTIKVYLKNGGLEYIKVVDDGEGMDSDDVLAAFLPHATSKIKTEYDLNRILTLGFRGEAIASIASVSTTTITSSRDGVEGYTCKYKAGVKQSSGVYNSNKGTTVEVEGLFFNTPARLKYLKPMKSELASILFFIARIAAAHIDLRFTVYNDDKLVFQTSGSNSYQTLIGEIYGLDCAKNVIEHSYVSDGIKVNLVFVKPSIYRSNKLEITMICNGRYVKNYNITNAVVDGFQTYLPISKYPIGILYFDVDPLLIDVNVHPTKTEIKISNEEEICSRLKEEVKIMLESDKHIPEREMPVIKPVGYKKTTLFEPQAFMFSEESFDYNEPESKVDVKEENVIENITKEENNDVTTMDIVKENTVVEIKERKLPYMEYVGTVFGTYLIFQNDEGMYMLDQHAAHERINYEKNYEILGNRNQPTTELIFPIMLEFTKQEALYIEDNLSLFEEIGFTLEMAGEKEFIVRGIPLWAKIDNVDNIIYNIIANMISENKIDIMYFRDSIAKQISCKSSIKANHYISKIEIDSLLNDLEKCKNPYTCPHGRPTLIKLTITEIEKMFERIQK